MKARRGRLKCRDVFANAGHQGGRHAVALPLFRLVFCGSHTAFIFEDASVSDANPPKTRTPEWCSCQSVVDRMLDYVESALSTEDQRQLDRHFKLCPPCREFLRQYRCVPTICERALERSMPEEAVERLRAFLKAKVEDEPTSR